MTIQAPIQTTAQLSGITLALWLREDVRVRTMYDVTYEVGEDHTTVLVKSKKE